MIESQVDDGPDIMRALCPWVDDDVLMRLARFEQLLRRWQRTHNLVGPASLKQVWRRHILDSLQLLDHAPSGARRWLDMGSGAGFPGLIIAIGAKGRIGIQVTLVDSNQKKCAFLRAAARACEIDVEIRNLRLEEHAKSRPAAYDVVSARALAPLGELLAMAEPFCTESNQLILLKGKDFANEEKNAAKSWTFDSATFQSLSDESGLVAVLRSIRRREIDV